MENLKAIHCSNKVELNIDKVSTSQRFLNSDQAINLFYNNYQVVYV